ncbi:two-component system, OmpR family, phosphate regulon sensor histidine kinase PhoR [Robiginitalea myxolifaciens]|uniref:histidine kinase n=1 Tax=Robiginitalea myxolifaciens TaxID=400055 RepID=A0A1I6FPJ6_9FLAO|nr:HAMP domain-containing sensor histidine kinase [Robiginitalea myxolifaciens]SFR31818.1 two-component system, OmpR family, phosphate regulon sensor histidine kinase PhoR [Robiginitalea myxolifaciens]
MKKRVLFIALFAISLAGLAVVQYQYLRIGLNLAGVQFSRKVAAAGDDIRAGLYNRNQLTYLLAGMLEQDSTRFNTGLDHMGDASRFFLEDFLREKLVDNEIDADFSYALITRDSSYYLNPETQNKEESSRFVYPIVVEGYLPNTVGQRIILQLQFEDLNRYFLTQLNGLTLPTLLFLIGIFVAVIWGLRTYYWQERTITTTQEFINNLTHELRTPVFSIRLAAKILKEQEPEDQKHLTDKILEESSRLSTHIEKVLELGSLERGATPVVLKSMDIRPVLERVCGEFSSQVSLEDISFTWEIPSEPLPFEGSEFHLENALRNLLDNARKYGEGNPVTLRATVSGKELEIQVRDSGLGIPKTVQARIFKKYYRAPQGDVQGVRGYGLGLSYVKTVVQRHRGRIAVESTPGEGTVFSVHLRLSDHG